MINIDSSLLIAGAEVLALSKDLGNADVLPFAVVLDLKTVLACIHADALAQASLVATLPPPL